MTYPPTVHNEARKDDIAKTVLMPGDPLRAKYIAENFLEDVKCVNSVRGMFGYTGFANGKRVTVQGSGMGVPSIGIYSYELFNFYEVDNIIRVGSTGALVPELGLRSVVIAIGACTDSNFQQNYKLPGTFAPTASFPLLMKAYQAAEEMKIDVEVGNILTSDVFYVEEEKDFASWAKMGVLAVEMETAALYMNAARAGKNALTILTVSDNIVTGEKLSSEARERSFVDMIHIALSLAE
jgi:purine-nucleoside phosphorylase